MNHKHYRGQKGKGKSTGDKAPQSVVAIDKEKEVATDSHGFTQEMAANMEELSAGVADKLKKVFTKDGDKKGQSLADTGLTKEMQANVEEMAAIEADKLNAVFHGPKKALSNAIAKEALEKTHKSADDQAVYVKTRQYSGLSELDAK